MCFCLQFQLHVSFSVFLLLYESSSVATLAPSQSSPTLNTVWSSCVKYNLPYLLITVPCIPAINWVVVIQTPTSGYYKSPDCTITYNQPAWK